MNDTAIPWHRRPYVRRGWTGVLLGLTAVRFVGAGSAEATTAPRSESQRLIVWFGDATS